MAEEEQLNEKEDKKAKREARKREKKQKKLEKQGQEINDEQLEEETGLGGKIAIFFATVIIIAIWLAILVLIIKWDVGGFGSTVMYPILKDVPYVNKILPEVEIPIEEREYPFTTISEATDYVKDLELQLEEAKKKISDKNDRIKELKAQIDKLSALEQNQAEFERLKQKFDKEVVFSDNAPDISNYQTYYESIDPANAEIIYRQVLEQQKKDADMEAYVKTYSTMKPKQAAAIFNTMGDQLKLVADILDAMDAQARADILGNMDTEIAARLTAIMEP